MEHTPEKKDEPKKNEMYLYRSQTTSWGSLISLLVVITIIVVGAFYAWGKRVDQGRDANQNLPTFKVGAQASPMQ